MLTRVKAQIQNGLLWKAVEKCGSRKALAEYLGISGSELCRWLNFRDAPPFRTAKRPKQVERYKRINEKLLLLIGHALEDIFPIELLLNKQEIKAATRIERMLELPVEKLVEAGFMPKQLLSGSPELDLEKLELHDDLEAAIATLSVRQAEVIRRRFGIGREGPQTFEEVAQALGVTRERIRQTEQAGLRKLREPLRSQSLKTHLRW